MPPPERSTVPRWDGPGSERNLLCPWPPPAFAQVCPLPREQTGTFVRGMHRKQVSLREGSYRGSALRCPPAGGASDPRRIARGNTSPTHGLPRLRRVEPAVCARTVWGDPIRRVADRQTLTDRVGLAEFPQVLEPPASCMGESPCGNGAGPFNPAGSEERILADLYRMDYTRTLRSAGRCGNASSLCQSRLQVAVRSGKSIGRWNSRP